METRLKSHLLTFSKYTDPGSHRELLLNLPDSIPEICRIIGGQLINSHTLYSSAECMIPEERIRHDEQGLLTSSAILTELLLKNPEGLVLNRTTSQRVISSCRGSCLLFASILRTKGIPCWVRAGFDSSLPMAKGQKIVDHWICDYWDDNEKQWRLIDPDYLCEGLCRWEISRDRYDFPANVWLIASIGKIDPSDYGMPPNHWGLDYIKGNLCHDFLNLMNCEVPYLEGPALFKIPIEKASKSDLLLTNKLAMLMQDPIKNFGTLFSLWRTEPRLQMRDI